MDLIHVAWLMMTWQETVKRFEQISGKPFIINSFIHYLFTMEKLYCLMEEKITRVKKMRETWRQLKRFPLDNNLKKNKGRKEKGVG